MYALVFLLPFLLFYEIGTILINPEVLNESLYDASIRVVSFVWIQNLLEMLGFSSRMTWVATPLVVIIILAALQITSRQKWRVRVGDLLPMTLECVIMALPLIVLSLLFNRTAGQWRLGGFFGGFGADLCRAVLPVRQAGGGAEAEPLFVDIVTGIGAGIYEELVFRLVLICLLMILLQDVGRIDRGWSVLLAVLVSAVLFSVHHHFFFINGSFETGEAFSVSRFLFRLMAGIYFAVLFAVRGFGVAAGSHVFYDIMAAGLNYWFFVGGE